MLSVAGEEGDAIGFEGVEGVAYLGEDGVYIVQGQRWESGEEAKVIGVLVGDGGSGFVGLSGEKRCRLWVILQQGCPG